MTRAPTVLQVLPRLITGGVERGTVEVSSALVKNGWRSVVASAGGPMVQEIEAAGGQHLTLPLASKNPFIMWANMSALVSVIADQGIDLIHARSRAPAWSAFYAARRTKKPFVTTLHNAYGGTSGIKLAYNSVMARGARVIAISAFVADYGRHTYHLTDEVLRTISRGVDLDRFSPATVSLDRINALRDTWKLPPTTPILMLPGRLTRWKGHDVFINALAKLSHRHFHAVIVGSGDPDYQRELEHLIHATNLDRFVSLVGECADMPAALSLATFVISASTRPEGFGRVIVEAEAMGRPVIASNHGGSQETVCDQKTGWLVPVNDVNALTRVLETALELSPDHYQAMSHNAEAFARDNYSISLMTEKTLAVYGELVRHP